MKKLLTAMICFAALECSYGQNEFAPVGMKWWVLVQIGFDLQEFYDTYECTRTVDTLGHSCKVVHEVPFSGNERDLLFYQEGDKVFMYDDVNEQFMLIFDYAKLAGEQYDIVAGPETYTFMVDSVTTTTLAGDDIQVQHGRIPHPQDPNEPFLQAGNKVYEGIGTDIGLWPELPTLVTPEIWYYLVCALKPDGKLYNINSFLDVDCQALATSTNNPQSTSPAFSVYPNPAVDNKTLFISNVSFGHASAWSLHDQIGREVKRAVFPAGQQEIELNISDLPNGLYFWQLQSNGMMLGSGKLVVAK
jgi:Secretion system C-terminal sorting domain